MKLRAGIIGLGSVSPMHVDSLRAIGVEVAAVCDKDFEKTKEFGCAAFSDFREMLDAGGFDALHICLPHYLHAPVSIAASEKCFHILCEKPMATNVADAEEMIATAKKNNVALGVVFQNRFSPGALLIKESLESGELGKVLGGAIRVTWNRGESYYSKSDWRGRWATEGGGVLINQSIHTFDMVNNFLGNPTDVCANIANRAHPSIEVEDVAEGIISYGEIKISFFVNTYHPYNAPASIELICENGRAELLGEDATVILNDGTKKTAGADIEAQKRFGKKSYWGVSHIKQIEAFYNDIANENFPEPTDALITQKLINAIYESAKK
ncbi:MAG: Gfo/Idh/MocA family oxidoreductase [Clostridiales bacterium]|jgi:predicted dehydrogenase|nr:Gfo/Idh/MocA family oxidoreductase [Clostridiales bacterium]